VNDTWVPALELAVAVTAVVVPKVGAMVSKVMSIIVNELVVPMPSSATMERWLTELGVRPTDADQLPEMSVLAVEVLTLRSQSQ